MIINYCYQYLSFIMSSFFTTSKSSNEAITCLMPRPSTYFRALRNSSITDSGKSDSRMAFTARSPKTKVMAKLFSWDLKKNRFRFPYFQKITTKTLRAQRFTKELTLRHPDSYRETQRFTKMCFLRHLIFV